jgi:hypothetical protein
LIKVFLAGEGRNELGGWSRERTYRDERPLLGVLESLARHVVPTGWEVHDAMVWKNIPKLAIGTRGKGLERKTVLAARLHAMESGCDVVVFSRDRDGPKKDKGEREQEIEAVLAELEGDARVTVVGAVCIERLESWLLALSGRSRTEGFGDAQVDEELAKLGIPKKDTVRMLELVERHGLAKVPPDARSLRTWIDRVRAALSTDPSQ